MTVNKSLNSHFLLFLITFAPCVVVSVDEVNAPSNIEQKICNLISYGVSHHYKPITIRPILFERESAFESSNLFWEIHKKLEYFPVLLIPEKLSPTLRNKFFTSIVIYWISNTEILHNFLPAHLENETANRRWDRLIFITSDTTLLTELFSLTTVLHGVKEKVGISLNQGIIWMEPRVHDRLNPNHIIKYDKVEQIIQAPKLGSNIKGRHFRIGGCEFPPWTMKIRDGKGGEQVAGTHFQIVAFASKKFNFTFETRVLNGPDYGELHKNGTWTGMYALIYYRNKNYDFLFMLGHDHSWSDYVDYSSTFGTIDLIFVTAHPTAELKWSAVFESYTNTVWAAIIVTFVIFSGTLFTFMRIQSNFDQFKGKLKALSLGDSFMMPYMMIIEQGVDIPKGVKFICGLWLVFTIIIGTGYKSTLKARLTFPSPEVLPTNYKELADRSDYRIILNAQGVVEKTFFSTTIVPEMVNIRKRMENEFFTEKCVTSAFMDGHTACIGWYPYYKQTVSATLTLHSSISPLIYTKTAAHFNTISMGFQKDSIFVDAFTPLTAALYETGLYYKWEEDVNKYYQEIGRRKVLEQKNGPIYNKLVELSLLGETVAKSLKFKNVWIVFCFLGLGLFSGVACLLFELIIQLIIKKKQFSS